MSPRKTMKRGQAKRVEKNIQAIALVAIMSVLGIFMWRFAPSPAPVRIQDPVCEVFKSVPAAEQYDVPPPLLIDMERNYTATISMQSGGVIRLELFADKAPVTVNSFIFLSCKGFFDGVTFHRVLPDFMAQTGDPTGSGMGGPGYRFDNEDNDLLFDKAGVVAMANAGRDTNGSQFFITFGPAESLNGKYTIFGQVSDGMDVVRAITLRDPQQNPSFEGDRIETIGISLE